ncbi:MAG: DUF3141 domain-containing protein [Acetobacteraceae bacterium]
MLGGTWLTSLAGDLGHGIFDGAMLVKNFESMKPSNTLWKRTTTSMRTWTPRRSASSISKNGGAARSC